jgi:hypothetical protein
MLDLTTYTYDWQNAKPLDRLRELGRMLATMPKGEPVKTPDAREFRWNFWDVITYSGGHYRSDTLECDTKGCAIGWAAVFWRHLGIIDMTTTQLADFFRCDSR